MERAHPTPKEGWWCNWFKVVLPLAFLIHQLPPQPTPPTACQPSPGQSCHKWSPSLSSEPVHPPQPSSSSKGGQAPVQHPLAPASPSAGCTDSALVNIKVLINTVELHKERRSVFIIQMNHSQNVKVLRCIFTLCFMTPTISWPDKLRLTFKNY